MRGASLLMRISGVSKGLVRGSNHNCGYRFKPSLCGSRAAEHDESATIIAFSASETKLGRLVTRLAVLLSFEVVLSTPLMGDV